MTSSKISLYIVSNRISIQTAAAYSGYSLHDLRRLLRNGQRASLKVDQVWLIDAAVLESYHKKLPK